ncbi:MAG: carbohydrate ABC transporter permease, partial [Eubacteriales bacterium]|nr:carbohydrate ABC transporter permease [Eubacteriales bacterium]
RPAWQWMLNTIVICGGAMLLTCVTSSMAGYVLAKKRFIGRNVIFAIFVCAMALPKQVIIIPLLREMNFLSLHNTLLAVILPEAAWPFGVFLMKQFSEGIPTEMLEAANIDGASEARTFTEIVVPLIKPGIGALAIFTFITAWNDYFLQLIMLNKNAVKTISLGIATMQTSADSTNFGLIMAGAALASVPIIVVFLMFQKFFTRGITMGAVKG